MESGHIGETIQDNAFGAFIGDNQYVGDGGSTLQLLWDSFRWKELKNCPGRYTCRNKEVASHSTVGLASSVLKQHQIAMIAHLTKEGKDPMTLIRFVDGGGILTYSKARPSHIASAEQTFVHTLNTESGLCRKLLAMHISFADLLTNAEYYQQESSITFQLHLHILSLLPESSLNPIAATICTCLGQRIKNKSSLLL